MPFSSESDSITGASIIRASAAPSPVSSAPIRSAKALLSSSPTVRSRDVGEKQPWRPAPDDLLLVHAEVISHLGGSRRTAEVLTELLPGGGETRLQLLEASRRAHRPGPVPEVLAYLPPDRGDGVGQEVPVEGRVEGPGRSNQSEVRHLGEVVVGHATSPVPSRDRARYLHVQGDDLV